MGGKMSRTKGAQGEREWAKWLTSKGFEAKRGCQHAGGTDSPDVAGGIPGTHCEVKRVEKLNLYSAMAQAVKDSGGEKIPYVAHRRNREQWLVTVRAEELLAFAELITGALDGIRRYEPEESSDE